MSAYTVDFSSHTQNFHAMLDSRRKDRRDNYLNSIDLTPKDRITYYSQIGNKTILDPVIDSKYSHVDVEHNRLKETTYEKDQDGNITDTLLVNPESTTFQPDSELSSTLVEYHGKDKVKDPNDIAKLNVVMRDSVTETKFIPSNKSVVPLDRIKKDKLTSYINKLHTSTTLSTTLVDHHQIQTANFDLSSSQKDTSVSDLQYVDTYIEGIFDCCGLSKLDNNTSTKIYFRDLVDRAAIKTYYEVKENLYGSEDKTFDNTADFKNMEPALKNFYILTCKPSELFNEDIKKLAELKTPIHIYSTTCLSCLELFSKIEPASITDELEEFTTKFNVKVISFLSYIDCLKYYYIHLVKNVYRKKYNYEKYVKTEDNRIKIEIEDPTLESFTSTDSTIVTETQNLLKFRDASSNKIDGLIIYHYVLPDAVYKEEDSATGKITVFFKPDSALGLPEDKPLIKITSKETPKEVIIYKKSIGTDISFEVLATTTKFFNNTDGLTKCMSVSEITVSPELDSDVGAVITGAKLTIDEMLKEVTKHQIKVKDVTEGTIKIKDSLFKKDFELEIKSDKLVNNPIIYYKYQGWKLTCQKQSDLSSKSTFVMFDGQHSAYVNGEKSNEGFTYTTIPVQSSTIEQIQSDEFRYYAKINTETVFSDWEDDTTKKTQLDFVTDINHVTYKIECKLDTELTDKECYVIIQLTKDNTYLVTECYDKEFDLINIKECKCHSVQTVSPGLYKLTFEDKANKPIEDVSQVLSNGYLAKVPLENSGKIHCVVPRSCLALYAVNVNETVSLVTYPITLADNKTQFKQLPVFNPTIDVDVTLTSTNRYKCNIYHLDTSESSTVAFGNATISEIPTTYSKIIVVVGESSDAAEGTKFTIIAVCNESYEVIEGIQVSDTNVTGITQTATTLTNLITCCTISSKPTKTSNLIYCQKHDQTYELSYIQLRDDVKNNMIPTYCKFDGSVISELYDSDFNRVYPIKQKIYTVSQKPSLIPQVVKTAMNTFTSSGTATYIEYRLKDGNKMQANLVKVVTVDNMTYAIDQFPTSSNIGYVIKDSTDATISSTDITPLQSIVVGLRNTLDTTSITDIRVIDDLYRSIALDYNVIIVKNKANDKNVALLNPFRLNKNINLWIDSNNKYKLIDNSDIELLTTKDLDIPTITGSRYVSTTTASHFIHKTHDLTLKVKYDEQPKYYNLVFKNIAVKDNNYNKIKFNVERLVDDDKITYGISDKYVELTSTQQTIGSNYHAFEKFEALKVEDPGDDAVNYTLLTPKSSSYDMISFEMSDEDVVEALKQSKDGKYYILALKIKKIDTENDYVYFTAHTDVNNKDYLNGSLTFYFSRPDYKCIAIKDNFNFIPKFEEFSYVDISTLTEASDVQVSDFKEPSVSVKYINRYSFELDVKTTDFTSRTDFRASAQYQGYYWNIKLDNYNSSVENIKIELEFADDGAVTIKNIVDDSNQAISYNNETSTVKFSLTPEFINKHQEFKPKGRYINIAQLGDEYIKKVLDKKCIVFKTNLEDVGSFDESAYSQQLGFYLFSNVDVDSIKSLQLIFNIDNYNNIHNDIYADTFDLDVVQARYIDKKSSQSHDITREVILVPFYVDELYNDVVVLDRGSIESESIAKEDYTSKIEREKLFLAIDTDNDDERLTDFVFTNVIYPTNADFTINQAIRPIAYVVKDTTNVQEVVCLTYDSRNDNDIEESGPGCYCDSYISQQQETQIEYTEASPVSKTSKTLDTTVSKKYDCYDFSGLNFITGTSSDSDVKTTLQLKMTNDKNVDKYIELTFDFDSKLVDYKITVNRIIVTTYKTADNNHQIGDVKSEYVFAMYQPTENAPFKLVKCNITCSTIETPDNTSNIPSGVKKHFFRAVSDEIVSAKTGSPEAAFGVKIQQPDNTMSYWTIQCAAPINLTVNNAQKLVLNCKKDEEGKYIIDDNEGLKIIDATSETLTETCRINKITVINSKRISSTRKNEYIKLNYNRDQTQSFTIDDSTQYRYMSNILAKDDTFHAYTIAKLNESLTDKKAKLDVNIINVVCNDETSEENQQTYITSVKNNDTNVIRKATDVSKLRDAKEVKSSDASEETSLDKQVMQLKNIEYPYINTIKTEQPDPEPGLKSVKPIDLSKESVGYILSLLKGKTIIKHDFSNDGSGYFTSYYIYDSSEVLQYITIGHLVFSLENIKAAYPLTGQVNFRIIDTTYTSKPFVINADVNSSKTITITSKVKPFGILDVVFKDLIVKKSSMELQVDSLELYQQDFKDIASIDNCRVTCDLIFTQGMYVNNYEPILAGKCVDIDILSGVLLKSFRLHTTIICEKLSFNGDRIILTKAYFEDYPYIPVGSEIIVLSSGQLSIEPIVKSDAKVINKLSLLTVRLTADARLFFVPVRISDDIKPEEYNNTFIKPWATTEQLLGLTTCYTIPKRSFVEYDRFMSMIIPTTFEVNLNSEYFDKQKVKSTQVRYSLDECNIDLDNKPIPK